MIHWMGPDLVLVNINEKVFWPRKLHPQVTHLVTMGESNESMDCSHNPGILTMRPIFTKIGEMYLGGIPDTLPRGQLLMWSQYPDIWVFVLCKNCFDKIWKKKSKHFFWPKWLETSSMNVYSYCTYAPWRDLKLDESLPISKTELGFSLQWPDGGLEFWQWDQSSRKLEISTWEVFLIQCQNDSY